MENMNNDTPDFDNIYEFMEYYGLKFADENETEIMMESIKDAIKSKIEKKIREKESDEFKKHVWETESHKLQKVKKNISLDDRKFDETKKLFETLRDSNMFFTYKNAFKKLCQNIGISPDSTINYIGFVKGKLPNENIVKINSTEKSKKIIIPAGSLLIHTSKVSGIRELKPSWKSKTTGRWLYPEQRVYFTIGKQIDPTKAGLEKSTLYKYTPRETFSTAYIDPDVPSFKDGAIFIKTSAPIPVIPLVEKCKKIFGRTYKKEYVPDENG